MGRVNENINTIILLRLFHNGMTPSFIQMVFSSVYIRFGDLDLKFEAADGFRHAYLSLQI